MHLGKKFLTAIFSVIVTNHPVGSLKISSINSNVSCCQDTDQSNIKSQRSYLTYGQRPCRIHFEQSDGYDLITSLHQIELHVLVTSLSFAKRQMCFSISFCVILSDAFV